MNWTALPSLSSLRAFAAYAETRSVQKAGAALNVSHAAISQQLRGLESDMGVALLDRAGRQLSLTPEGETLARSLLDGFGMIAQTIEALTGIDATRPLQISTTPTLSVAWLMPRLARFQEQHPDISLMIDPTAAVQPFVPGGLDVALRYGNGNWPGLEAELLVESPVAVVAAPALVGDRRIETPQDLAPYHWIQEIGTNEATDWLAEQGVSREAGLGTSAMPGNMMLEAARLGQGIAIVARVFVEQDVAAGRLRVLFEDGRRKGYYVVTRPGVPRPPLKAFLRWLRQEARHETDPRIRT